MSSARLSKTLKVLAQRGFTAAGVTVTRSSSHGSPFKDMARLVGPAGHPLIIDVGANVGQSVERFKAIFPDCEIHSFEPSPSTFVELERNVARHRDVHLNRFGIGATTSEALLQENTYSDMSSFLAPGRAAWGALARQTPVHIERLDNYADSHHLGMISILKTDTQGFDFEVLKGAERLLDNNKIQMVYMEIIFSDMYQNLPTFEQILRFLRDYRFRLVGLSNFYYQEGLLSWCDGLFVNSAFVNSTP